MEGYGARYLENYIARARTGHEKKEEADRAEALAGAAAAAFAKEVAALPFDFDYVSTLAWYEKFEAKCDAFVAAGVPQRDVDDQRAYLACNDRYYLLVHLLGREDLKHPWLYDRCRQVEAEPYGHIDLWARAHGKSSIITNGGIIQEIIRDPEVTVAIFSVTRALAQEFLAQIKNEFETNDDLKRIFDDVLYDNPRGKENDGSRPAKWSLARGITVRRKGHPKEATVEAHGLLDGQPTGRHFRKHYYDDIVTQDYIQEEQLKKTTERFEMADNLGTRHGVDKCIAGTCYHFADAYAVMLNKGSGKPRRHPATEDGTINGKLVLLTAANWERIKRTQGLKTLSAQMLLNPLAGNEATFRSLWLRTYEVVPRILNVYIMVDPSKGRGERSDRTAIPVIGIDPAGNKYLLDGVCHRMRLSERWDWVKQFKATWENHPGVQSVQVGWEQYGMQVDLEVVQEKMLVENNSFPIIELNTPQSGGHAKGDRIERLEPDFRAGSFYLPCSIYNSEFGLREGQWAGICLWSVWTEEDAQNAVRANSTPGHHIGQIVYRPQRGLTKLQRDYGDAKKRVVMPIVRRDENKDRYDLTYSFIQEFILHPFAPHDDLLDAVSRIYDMKPLPPMQIDAKAAESLDVDDRGIDPGTTGDTID